MKEEAISLSPLYYFSPLYRHLDISCEITAESSFLHIGNSRNRIGNVWFPSASRQPVGVGSRLGLSKDLGMRK